MIKNVKYDKTKPMGRGAGKHIERMKSPGACRDNPTSRRSHANMQLTTVFIFNYILCFLDDNYTKSLLEDTVFWEKSFFVSSQQSTSSNRAAYVWQN